MYLHRSDSFQYTDSECLFNITAIKKLANAGFALKKIHIRPCKISKTQV